MVGAPAIAAETEAIELLLQAKRQSPKGGGGGGSNPGGGGTADSASQAALADLFAAAQARGLASDGVIAASQAQRDALWAVRERLPEANRRIGAVSSHDISVPLGAIDGFVDRAGRAVAAIGDFRINCFGHLGDGNLHFNVFPPAGKDRADYREQSETVRRAVHDLVHEMGGSISAEHGIGRMKVADLERYGDPVRLDAMRAIKAALDPAGIMNPGAVLRSMA